MGMKGQLNPITYEQLKKQSAYEHKHSSIFIRKCSSQRKNVFLTKTLDNRSSSLTGISNNRLSKGRDSGGPLISLGNFTSKQKNLISDKIGNKLATPKQSEVMTHSRT